MIERRTIVQAAFDVMSEGGLRLATAERVAERAGIEPGAVRALFPRDTELLDAVLQDTTEPIISAVAIAVTDISEPLELLSTTFRMLDDWLQGEPRYARLFLWIILDGGDATKRFFERSMMSSEMMERIQEFVSTGRLLTDDLMVFLTLFESLVFYPHLLRGPLENLFTPDAVEEHYEKRAEAVLLLLEGGILRRDEASAGASR